jgi:hypothetical protein
MKFTAVSFNFELWSFKKKLIETVDDEIPEFKRLV